MTIKLTETAKQAAVMAFSQGLEKSTYDVLMDDRLFPELAELWDCATLAELRACVAERTSRPTTTPAERKLRIAAGCFLLGAYACLPLNDDLLPEPL